MSLAFNAVMKLSSLLPGVAAVAALATAAWLIAGFDFAASLRLSPLIFGIVIGALVGNVFGSRLPASLSGGVTFCTKRILRAAIVLYGFKITFSQVAELGVEGLLLDVIMVGGTLCLGAFAGIRVFKVDRATAWMVASGAAICGAAAVIATEPVVKGKSHQTAAAVVTVVVFGTLSMFLYPILYRADLFQMSEDVFGVYIGASVHEVAHVVGAGEAVSQQAGATAVIVKMTRVLLLAPALLGIGWLANRGRAADGGPSTPLPVPWFALGFIAVVGLNTTGVVPPAAVDWLKTVDNFMLTMAMTALGMNTVFSKFRGMGLGPMYLAVVLFVWLVGGGYLLTTLLIA